MNLIEREFEKSERFGKSLISGCYKDRVFFIGVGGMKGVCAIGTGLVQGNGCDTN